MAEPEEVKVQEEIFRSMGETPDDDGTQEEQQPLYQVYKDTHIPVPKDLGKLWKSRRDLGMKLMKENYTEAWLEAIRYYNNDHSSQDAHRDSKGTRRRGDETENLVFANVTTLMPILYNKNPTIEVSNLAEGEEAQEEQMTASMFKRLSNVLINRKTSPGINLKKRIRRQTLFALLCNIGWIKFDWVDREDSSEAVVDEINSVAAKYKAAKDVNEIKECEGMLASLHDKFSFAQPKGPKLTVKHLGDVICDPEAEDSDLSDANWMMERDYIQTELLNALYLSDNDNEDGRRKLLYKPTHILSSEEQNDPMFVTNGFSELTKDKNRASDFGFVDDEQFKAAQYTEVWYVWDKITRRVFLFHSNDWTWPLWVWDDPFKASRFFPYFALTFHESVEGMLGKGEVTYYLDQQDALNEMNAAEAKARKDLLGRIIYHRKRVSGEEVEKAFSNNDNRFVGIDLPEGVVLRDVIMQMDSIYKSNRELFDRSRIYGAVNRITGISEIMRGEQLRTNTTEDAANLMADAASTRIDEKNDKIEEEIADIVQFLLEVCVQKLNQQEVSELVGSEYAQFWREMTPQELNSQFSFRIVAGSTEKPTSKAKQQKALQTGQVLGQFVNAAPATITVILKLFQKAFSDFDISDSDWQMIIQTMEAQMQKGISTQGNGGAAPTSGQPQQGGGGDEQMQQLLSGVMKLLAPEVKQSLQQAVSQGANPVEALMQMASQVAQQQ
jgi:hypothetical protein